jgi:type III restriction enzyme
VTVVLGLRPFTAKAEILPEQVIGRGLRLLSDIGPERTQTLEVLGTKKLLDFLREELEREGVGVGVSKGDPAQPITIQALKNRAAYDIAIPLTKPRLTHRPERLKGLDVSALGAIFEQDELASVYRDMLRMEFATTKTEVHTEDLAAAALPEAQELLGSITSKTIQRARLSAAFAEIYPLVRSYVEQRCFGKNVGLDKDSVRSHLRRTDVQDAIAKYLARELATRAVVARDLEFENATFRLSETKAFSWRRNLEPAPLVCKRTVFNYVATYNKYERRFAEFLDRAKDVARFASLGTTEQGESGSQFRVDYLKPSGAIGFYHPDWVVVQETADGEVNWIIETKGRVWEDTKAKDEAIGDWCARISERTGQTWRFERVNQTVFDRSTYLTLSSLLAAVAAERERLA